MDNESQSRLSRITTLWSLVQKAHAHNPDAGLSAQQELMQRYYGAAYRYLLGATRDEETALELFQEFALRFVRGDFHRADPGRGRFRDYLKTSLSHLVSDHWRARQAQPGPLPADCPAPPSHSSEPDDAAFNASWREELLERTWASLAEANSGFHAVLLSHAERPDLLPYQRAEELSDKLRKPMSTGNMRVMLHRARAMFAALLLEEVRRSLGDPSAQELTQELRVLGLQKLCQSALDAK
jgi:RNA polymerase sigma-70 factor (ECF subfamily)